MQDLHYKARESRLVKLNGLLPTNQLNSYSEKIQQDATVYQNFIIPYFK